MQSTSRSKIIFVSLVLSSCLLLVFNIVCFMCDYSCFKQLRLCGRFLVKNLGCAGGVFVCFQSLVCCHHQAYRICWWLSILHVELTQSVHLYIILLLFPLIMNINPIYIILLTCFSYRKILYIFLSVPRLEPMYKSMLLCVQTGVSSDSYSLPVSDG